MSSTLTSKLTLSGTAADFGAALNLSVSKALTIQKPYVGISREVVTTVGPNHKIVPNVDARRYVYVKHTGVKSDGSASTDDLHIETYTDNASGDQAIIVLKAGEFAFFPFDNAIASPDNGGDDNVIQLQASANTVVAEWAYFTVAS